PEYTQLGGQSDGLHDRQHFLRPRFRRQLHCDFDSGRRSRLFSLSLCSPDLGRKSGAKLMPAPQFIEGKPVIKYEEQYKQSAVITAGTNDTRQSTITIQRGMRAFIIRLSQAWDAGLDPNVTWRLLV